jgi:hypothetical protein
MRGIRSGGGSIGDQIDPRERLLLEAAVCEDERARDAWNQWSMRVRGDRLTYADLRLLASAHRRLRELGIEDPVLELARGAHRRAWYDNQLRIRRAGGAVADLTAAGIQPLVLKGAALALLHYRDLGARPMRDVDLLVGPSCIREAVRVLASRGWHVAPAQGRENGPLNYGTHIEDGAGYEIDLHAYGSMESADDSDFWESSVPLSLLGTPARALGSAEQLLHVCVHGARWDEGHSAGWAVDAMAILRSADELDWERLVERTVARRLTVAVGDALGWLRESLGADVPSWVSRAISTGPRLRFEQGIHRLSTRAPERWHFALFAWDRYRRFRQLAPAERRPRSFSRFLQSAWELESRSQLLAYGLRRLAGPRLR